MRCLGSKYEIRCRKLFSISFIPRQAFVTSVTTRKPLYYGTSKIGHFHYQLEKEGIRGSKIFLVVIQGHVKRPAVTAIPSATGASNILSIPARRQHFKGSLKKFNGSLLRL